MTTIHWTEPANDDFLGVIEWLNARNPAAAARVGHQILDSVERLGEHPSLTPGATASDPPRIYILRVLHGAMLWPRPGI